MTFPGEQSFTGASHRIRLLLQPSRREVTALYVFFADAADEPQLQFVDELTPLDIARLHVVDDFGPYAGDAGYPGSWYLGEGRRLTFANDVTALVDHAARTLRVSSAQITAVGLGAGGFAALHLALRNGWGSVIAGFPQTRLGRHFVGDLEDVATFVAGGTTAGDRHWLDELIFDALAGAESLPRIEILSGGMNYGRHVLPLVAAAAALGTEVELQLVEIEDRPAAVASSFAAYLLDRLGDLDGSPRQRLSLDLDPEHYACPWSSRSDPRISRVADGLRCFAPATQAHSTAVYAGLRFEAGPARAIRIELTLRRPGELEGLLVDAVDAADKRLARWQWRFDYRPPQSGRTTLVLTAADGGPMRATIHGELDWTATLDVFVRLKPGRSADFTVHEIAVLPPDGSPPPDAGLELPVATDTAAGVRRLRDHAAVARQVAALVAEGSFPPPAVLPDRAPSRPKLKVACLLDAFSELGFRYEFDYVDFTPEDFREVIDRERPDMLLVESIWRGKDESWNKLMVPDISGSGPTEPVRELVAHCRSRGIPTVFWNKEDSVNFEHFVQTAVLFDYIFTTDESCVPRYQAITGHDRVAVLPFAAQPAIHNPIGAPVQRPLDVAFLGTFYGRKHAARKRQMEMILDPAREFGVHIYSRVEATGGYAFPQKYVPHLIGTVPYEHVLGAYRTYKILLNVNSVPDSTTMCARRVFEILACGGSVVSGPSPALEAVLGPNAVHESDSYAHTREALEHILTNNALRERSAIEGIRRISRGHTYSHRVDEILRHAGLNHEIEPITVALVAAVGDDDQAREIVETAAAQSRPPDELVLIAPSGAIDGPRHRDAAGRRGIDVIAIEGDGDRASPGGARLAAAVQATSSRLIGTLTRGGAYGDNYLEDLVYAHGQSAADVVGKGAHYRFDTERGWMALERRQDEHRFVDAVHPDTILAERGALTRVRPAPGEELEAWQRRCTDRGLRIYAADRFNFAVQGGASGGGGSALVETFGTGPQHALA